MQENQRYIKELLCIMLNNINYLRAGLCNLANILLTDGDISGKEYYILIEYITKNRPSKFSSISAYRNRESIYYWERGQIAPRIKWLKKHIKRNSK